MYTYLVNISNIIQFLCLLNEYEKGLVYFDACIYQIFT